MAADRADAGVGTSRHLPWCATPPPSQTREPQPFRLGQGPHRDRTAALARRGKATAARYRRGGVHIGQSGHRAGATTDAPRLPSDRGHRPQNPRGHPAHPGSRRRVTVHGGRARRPWRVSDQSPTGRGRTVPSSSRLPLDQPVSPTRRSTSRPPGRRSSSRAAPSSTPSMSRCRPVAPWPACNWTRWRDDSSKYEDTVYDQGWLKRMRLHDEVRVVTDRFRAEGPTFKTTDRTGVSSS